jgi:hypothetical protein
MINEGSIGSRLEDRQIPVLYLIKLELADGTVYFTNWSQSIEWDGQVWSSTNITPNVSTMEESSNLESQALNISLSPVSPAMLSLALENPSNYRGLPCSIYMSVLDDNFRPLGDPMLRWYGYMDTMSISTDVTEDGVTGSVNLKCETGMHALRRLKTYRMNNAQQQIRVPGDKGFEYVERLIAEPMTWLSVKFQRQE